MAQKNNKKKFIRLIYLIVLPAIIAVLLGAYLLGEFGLPFDSHLGNRQRKTQTIYTHKKWAERIELPGLPNLNKVSDDLYRGAQPTAEGMKELEKLGIKTVVNLRSLHSDRDEIKDTALAYEHINMTTWKVEDEDVVRFLRIVTDPNRTPVFVHCQHGADRTGTVCAVYRIAVQGWSKGEALSEMTEGGFGFHSIWQNLPDYVRKLDVEDIKNRTNLK
ncbi:MAG: dual specificity protein phosphatase family protein [Planctomycetota bacterium]|jgi:protein tyrosine/serine phosphatase